MNTKKLILGTLALIVSQVSFAALETDLGKGVLQYDKAAGVKDRCIELKQENIFKQVAGQTSYELLLVKNKEELYDKISTSANAEGSYGVFSASAKAKFVKEVKWDFNSNYILVKAVRVTSKEKISTDNILMTEYAKNLLLESKFRFLESCGNSFAQTVLLGGEIYGVIEIQASNYQEKQKITSSLEGSGSMGAFSASGGATFKRTIEKLTSTYKNKVHFGRLGKVKVEVPNTVEGLLELSSKIETISDAGPVAIGIETRDYSTVSNYELTTDQYKIKIRQESITWAENKLQTARNLYSQILYILENPADFRRFDEVVLKEKLQYLDEKILEVKTFVYKSYSFLNESDPSKLELNLDIELPEMRRKAERAELKITCETKASPLCGVASYKEQRSSACNVLGPKTGTGPSCGTVYKQKASEACGAKIFNEKRGEECGVSRYKQCHHKDCGTEWNGARKRCRTKACGVDDYKSCRHKNFGVEEFNTCRDEAHGIEKFLTCAHKDFGYDFESCEHLTHGPGKFNTCEITKIGTQETFCPEF